jgi:alginate O-acetyltransferase complex protein AlgI
MLFNTAQYALFLAAVLIVFRTLPRSWRSNWLLLASLVFYGLWIPVYLLLFVAVLAVNYVLAIAIDRYPGRRWPLAASVGGTLGVLGYFKYRIFFAENLKWLTASATAGGDLSPLFLPLGISFYSFQIIALNVDLFRRQIPLPPSFARYALFIAFFPQLIAGPILRGSEFLSQLDFGGFPTSERTRRGVWLLVVGLAKKVILGDFLLAPFVEGVFAHPGMGGAPAHLLAVYSTAFLIYCDFSGYSDMARGSACLFGFDLPRNFAEPFLSRNPAEFWRRWHMTLSRWLRDYLYIPLGGNRGGSARTLINLTLTMVLGGLWHGASWNFVLWGALHGLLLVAHRLWTNGRGDDRLPWQLIDVGKVTVVFHATCLLWVLFRAPDLSSAATIYRTLLVGDWSGQWPLFQILVVSLCAAAHVVERWVTAEADTLLATTANSSVAAVAEGAMLGGLLALSVLCNGTGGSFIYFQF